MKNLAHGKEGNRNMAAKKSGGYGPKKGEAAKPALKVEPKKDEGREEFHKTAREMHPHMKGEYVK
jgi:hypothetical protein